MVSTPSAALGETDIFISRILKFLDARDPINISRHSLLHFGNEEAISHRLSSLKSSFKNFEIITVNISDHFQHQLHRTWIESDRNRIKIVHAISQIFLSLQSQTSRNLWTFESTQSGDKKARIRSPSLAQAAFIDYSAATKFAGFLESTAQGYVSQEQFQFPQFNSLPIELRQLIWTFVAEQERTVVAGEMPIDSEDDLIHPDEWEPRSGSAYYLVNQPSILRVDREARMVGLRHYKLVGRRHSTFDFAQLTYINWSCDIIWHTSSTNDQHPTIWLHEETQHLGVSFNTAVEYIRYIARTKYEGSVRAMGFFAWHRTSKLARISVFREPHRNESRESDDEYFGMDNSEFLERFRHAYELDWDSLCSGLSIRASPVFSKQEKPLLISALADRRSVAREIVFSCRCYEF